MQNNQDYDPTDITDNLSIEWFHIIYARKTKRHNWEVHCTYGSTVAEKLRGLNVAADMINAWRKNYPNSDWEVQAVMYRRNDYSGSLNSIDNIPFNTNWLDLRMIPVYSLQQNPNQTIHNG
jgi:hypothetical protein